MSDSEFHSCKGSETGGVMNPAQSAWCNVAACRSCALKTITAAVSAFLLPFPNL